VRYVGKTTNVERRFSSHISRSKRSKHHAANWIRSLLNLSLKPIIEIVEICDNNNWEQREKYWISYYRQFYDLTNTTDGGEGGATYGRTGRPWSEQQRINNRKSRLGVSIRQSDKNGKRKEARREYFNRTKKPVVQYSSDGVIIKELPSTVEAAKELGLINSNIIACCKSETKKAGGFRWKYKEK